MWTFNMTIPVGEQVWGAQSLSTPAEKRRGEPRSPTDPQSVVLSLLDPE